MALTCKSQFLYLTGLNTNAGEALQELTTALKVMNHSQNIGTLVEFHRLFNSEFDNEQHSVQLSWTSFDS
jgi:hypothetical protein